MRNDSFPFSRLCLAVAILLAAPVLTSAQTSLVQPRITAAIDEHNLTILKGNTHPLARAEFDRGAAPVNMPLRRMLLVLKRSSDQEAALNKLMEEQQDASSPNFHNWLTPVEFGQQFGPSDQDIQSVTSWLESHGFQIAKVSNGRMIIEFSGTAGQVQDAFHTAIHKYSVNGEEHWANASDPQIPAALAPVVTGINTLYNFPREQMHRIAGVYSRTRATGAVSRRNTQFTFPDPCNANSQPFCNFAVAPADFAKIYDVPNLLLTPAPATKFNGDGVSIAIVAQSDIVTKDLTDFRTLFGLPAPTLNVILNGPDPGLDPGGAETEADLDVQWAGAVAPNAILDLVVSESTEVSLGADLSAQYAVDNNLAPILNESFGLCEFFIGTSVNTFYNQVWQQAAAQGITVTVSSGDSGAAGCNRGQGPATFGLAVSGFTSTPFNVSVGGTDFNDLNNAANFWKLNSGDTPTAPSALGYIPEMTWNDTCTNQEIFSFFGVTTAEQACNNPNVQFDGLVAVAGGSGGKSGCTTSDGQNEATCGGGYPKPPWQTALTPADGKRDIPDVSLFAADGFNGSFYLICEADLAPGETSCDPFAAQSDAVGLGGTSASSPSFAGIMALVNQATGSRQGNANYILYKLAAQSGATCPSAASPASTCVFYDVPAGSTIAMPCTSGSPNCTVSTGGDQLGVLSGFATSAGYDLATGLGSVNAANLISKWKAFALTLKTSSTTLTLNSGNPVNITHGQSVNVNIGVTGTGGPPTGTVSLVANTAPPSAPSQVTQQGVQDFTLPNGSGSVSGNTTSLPGGTYTVFAQYPGDGTFGSSTSTPPISVTVAKEASKAQIAYELFDPNTGIQTNPNATTAVYGSFSLLRINVTSSSGDACPNNGPGDTGCPTGNIVLTDNNNPLDAGTFLLNSQGYAEDQTISLPAGVHPLKAVFGGDNSFTGSTGTDSVTITQAATTTNLISGVAFTFLGDNVNLSATISTTSFGVPPTGTVTFFDNGTQFGSPVAVIGDTLTGSPEGRAGLSTSSLPVGLNHITVQYNGDTNYTGSVSGPVTVDILIFTNTTVNSSNPTIQHGQSVTFTAQVTATQGGGPALTGTVQFMVNGINAGGPVALSPSGQAQLVTSSLPAGTPLVAAFYSGDNDYFTSNGSVTETVNLLGTTTTIGSSSATITQGSSVTFTGTVTPSQAGPALTGTVQFQSNGSNIGNAVALASGQAQLATTALPAGTLQITAIYSGDTNYSGSTSAPFAETVNPAPTFTVTANPTTIPVTAPGATGMTTLTFTGQNGFSSNGAVTISPVCTGLPSESTCSSGSSVTIAANGTATATLSIQTRAPSNVFPSSRNRPNLPGWRMATASAMALACLLCAWMLALGYRGKQRRWGLALVFTIFVTLAVAAGCGGGGGGGGIHDPGTPLGTKAISVMITINGVTQTVPNLSVNVQ